MNIFYTTNIKGGYAHLPEDEARHCVQVLRKKEGDTLHLIDGKGNFYEGEISETGKKKCVIKIIKTTMDFGKRPYRLHVGIAPPKNMNRLEWFLEKATEIGIDEITPMICQRSERKNIRMDRLQKVILSATKQSLKAYLPTLNPLTKFQDFIKKESYHPETEQPQQKFIAHCEADIGKKHLQDAYLPAHQVTMLIGPEGDFTSEEIDLAFQHGFSSTSLGETRLRLETAGIFACTIFNLKNFGV